LSSGEKRSDDLVDKLVLDIKALALLSGSEADLKEKLRGKVVESHDESIEKFLKAVQKGPKPETGRLLAVAIGELVLASLLVLAGTLSLIPTVVGIDTPAGLVQYFAERTYGAIGFSPFGQYVSVVGFVLGALLILSAFYTLRQAAINLREAGLSVKTGEG
jgi:preprotein translocase subunit Sec61beta